MTLQAAAIPTPYYLHVNSLGSGLSRDLPQPLMTGVVGAFLLFDRDPEQRHLVPTLSSKIVSHLLEYPASFHESVASLRCNELRSDPSFPTLRHRLPRLTLWRPQDGATTWLRRHQLVLTGDDNLGSNSSSRSDSFDTVFATLHIRYLCSSIFGSRSSRVINDLHRIEVLKTTRVSFKIVFHKYSFYFFLLFSLCLCIYLSFLLLFFFVHLISSFLWGIFFIYSFVGSISIF